MNLDNHVFLCGRLTKDVEVKKTKNGHELVKFNLAVNRAYGDNVDFITCTAWRHMAKYLGKYAKKGDLIQVAGELNINVNDDKYYAEVNCSAVNIRNKKRSEKKKTQDTETTEDEDEVYEKMSDVSEEDIPF